MSGTTHTVEGRALTMTDKDRVAEFNQHVQDSVELPAEVRDGVVTLLGLVADGHDIVLFDRDSHLSPNEAARLVGVSRPLLNRLLDEGQMPFFETAGGHRKIKTSAIRDYIDARDLVAEQLAAARAARQRTGKQIADELRLDPSTSDRLGFT